MERASGDMALKIHLEELCHLRQILAKLNRAILALSRTEEYRPWVRLLRTVPGISTLTAMILLMELGEITRFRSIDQLCSYVGLIPDTQSSGEKEHVGGVTQRGHSHLRWLLMEASWVAVRKDPAMMDGLQSVLQTDAQIQGDHQDCEETSESGPLRSEKPGGIRSVCD